MSLIIRSLLLCAGATLAAVLLSLAGWWIVAIFVSVGFGFLGMSVGELDDRRGSSSVAAFGGLLIVVTASILSLARVETRLWPKHATGLTLEQAHEDPWPTSFTFAGGRPRPELIGRAAVFGRYGSTVDNVSVVPVVEESWTPQDPIHVWAVARRDTFAERSRLWREPIRSGVRVAGFYASDYQSAVSNAHTSYSLRVAPDPLFIQIRCSSNGRPRPKRPWLPPGAASAPSSASPRLPS
jgi:hypothetical protein